MELSCYKLLMIDQVFPKLHVENLRAQYFSGYSLEDLNSIFSLNFLMSLIYFLRFCVFLLHPFLGEK